jgi:NAD(P)-dependent dehydrogenase (short-subunit alcohol dehydrogenase family)
MIDGPFKDQTAIVTGGGSGIGRAVASALAAEGAHVVLAGRQQQPLDETVEHIVADGGSALALTADVSHEADVSRLVNTVIERFGRLDIAFNNAGVNRPGQLADLDLSDWNQVMTVNTTGTWLCMKHEIGAMRTTGGVIVNTASNVGDHLRRPGMGAYAASKAAVSIMTRTAALENIAAGIRINAISPGPVDTPMSYRAGETRHDRDIRLKSTNPSGRAATLIEIVNAVLWLCSPASSYVVGQDLVVDGGASA